MNKTKEIFESLQLNELNENLLSKLELIPNPRIKYILAVTPRSGSTFLCDVLKKTQVLGHPHEFLNEAFIPRCLTNKIPAKTPDTYFKNITKAWKTKNGVAGIKASWFQFNNLYTLLVDSTVISEYKFIYLTRSDLALQAVSLYKATESSVFHSVATPSEEAIEKLNNLEYDFEKIDFWYQHIVAQEQGWEAFFSLHNISPLRINYDDVVHDWYSVVKKIALFVGLKAPGLKKIDHCATLIKPDLEKIGDEKNIVWANRFLQEIQQEIIE
jgi:LPS sulfotransferase NodH